MSNGAALYLGRVGSTGTSTGPHAHWQVKKDGKLIPLSTARTDIGQYIQFRRPGQADWTSLYTKGQDGNFALAPGVEAPEGTSAFGMREKHPVHGDRRMHWGEDYKFDEGTQLRFLGQGSVSTHASRGGAGNVSALRLPSGYELETLHLSELPNAATTYRSSPSSGLEEEGPAVDKDTLQSTMKNLLFEAALRKAQNNSLLSGFSPYSQVPDPVELFKRLR
jgi:murein DD-endopeptidase MepM/ murein hydrolase activator NlpD